MLVAAVLERLARALAHAMPLHDVPHLRVAEPIRQRLGRLAEGIADLVPLELGQVDVEVRIRSMSSGAYSHMTAATYHWPCFAAHMSGVYLVTERALTSAP